MRKKTSYLFEAVSSDQEIDPCRRNYDENDFDKKMNQFIILIHEIQSFFRFMFSSRQSHNHKYPNIFFMN